MVERLNKVVEEKLGGSGLAFKTSLWKFAMFVLLDKITETNKSWKSILSHVY